MTTEPDKALSVRAEPYQPSCSFEGAAFMAKFCDHCVKDKPFRDGTGDSCPIAADTMVYSTDDPEYPSEWTYDDRDNPVCTAFVLEDATLTEKEPTG